MPPRAERVSVLVVTMFASELKPWKDRFGFDEGYEFAAGDHDLLFERSSGVLLMVAGVGATEAATSVMAVGLDPRFDLTDAYVVVLGIAGGNPDVAGMASVVVGDWVLDTDLAQEIDARELPADRAFSKNPLFKPRYELPAGPNRGEAIRLHQALAAQVLEIAKSVELHDPPFLSSIRDEYTGWRKAAQEPDVAIGAIVAGSTMWHGALLNAWATEWVSYWTEGESVFAASSMEDAGVVVALRRLAAMARLDFGRVTVLRSVCNFTVQPDGMTAAESLEREEASGYSAIAPAVENVFRVGSAVVRSLVSR